MLSRAGAGKRRSIWHFDFHRVRIRFCNGLPDPMLTHVKSDGLKSCWPYTLGKASSKSPDTSAARVRPFTNSSSGFKPAETFLSQSACVIDLAQVAQRPSGSAPLPSCASYWPNHRPAIIIARPCGPCQCSVAECNGACAVPSMLGRSAVRSMSCVTASNVRGWSSPSARRLGDRQKGAPKGLKTASADGHPVSRLDNL